MSAPTKRWRRMAGLYRRFAKDYPQADFGEAAAVEMFVHESRGGPVSAGNGFALGKKWLAVTVAAWREDIRDGLLSPKELRDDGFPDWFLAQEGAL